MSVLKDFRIIAGAAVMLSLSVSGAVAETLRLLSAWDAVHPTNIHIVEEFAKRVAERTGNELEISIGGPEVVTPFEQVEPVQAGVYQMLFTHAAYHSGVTRAAFGLDSTVNPDPQARHDSGLWAAVDEAYNALGLKLISLAGAGKDGYQFLLREPLREGDQPFAGMKIRGTPPYKAAIEALGGAMVVMPGGEMYSALDRNVVQGAGWPTGAVRSVKLEEVAKYYVRPAFGSNSQLLLMNLDAWNGLSPEQQEILLDIGAELEVDSPARLQAVAAEELEALKAAGMQEATLTDDQATRMMDAFVTGYRDLALETNEPAAKRVVDILNASEPQN